MNKQPASQFRLEPRALGWHDLAGVGYGDELLHAGGMQQEGRTFARSDPALQFRDATRAPDEINAGIGAGIAHVQYGAEHPFVQQTDVERAGGWSWCGVE